MISTKINSLLPVQIKRIPAKVFENKMFNPVELKPGCYQAGGPAELSIAKNPEGSIKIKGYQGGYETDLEITKTQDGLKIKGYQFGKETDLKLKKHPGGTIEVTGFQHGGQTDLKMTNIGPGARYIEGVTGQSTVFLWIRPRGLDKINAYGAQGNAKTDIELSRRPETTIKGVQYGHEVYLETKKQLTDEESAAFLNFAVTGIYF